MFHKTVHKTRNHFKHSEQLLENLVKKLVLRVLIGREELSIDRMFFSTDRTTIESSNDFWIIFSIISIDWAKHSISRIYWISNFTLKISIFEFSLYETIFSKFKYHYYNLFMYIPIYTIGYHLTQKLKLYGFWSNCVILTTHSYYDYPVWEFTT